MIQTAEGALTEVNNMVVRIRELTVQAANGTNTGEDREKMAAEVIELLNEIDATSARTEFNTKKVIGTANNNIDFQIGANKGQSLGLTFNQVNTEKVLGFKGQGTANGLKTAFGLTPPTQAGNLWKSDANADLATITSANYDAALTEIDAALKGVAEERSKYGANQNRLEYTINNLNLSSENLSAAKSRIEDADMAKEMMNLTSANVLQQAATSMLAQANQAPNSITQLLG